MKNTNVCKGCKYHVERGEFHVFNNTCAYSVKTGRSRLRVERENGGYQKDACICYEERRKNEGNHQRN